MKLNFESFKTKLGEWSDKFRPFIESKEMWDIMQKVKKDAFEEGVVPESPNTFRAFSTVKPSDIKVIFYLMDPYPRLYKDGKPQATGIAMDCSNSPDGKLQPSLINWYNALEKEVGKVQRTADLTYLHEQGVMMLNTDLTCIVNKTSSHEGLWEPFQKYFLENVVQSDTQIIYVLCGKVSHKLEKYINPFCTIFKLSHPASASHSHTDWDSKGVFKTINKLLKERNNFEIFWDVKAWEALKQLPF